MKVVQVLIKVTMSRLVCFKQMGQSTLYQSSKFVSQLAKTKYQSSALFYYIPLHVARTYAVRSLQLCSIIHFLQLRFMFTFSVKRGAAWYKSCVMERRGIRALIEEHRKLILHLSLASILSSSQLLLTQRKCPFFVGGLSKVCRSNDFASVLRQCYEYNISVHQKRISFKIIIIQFAEQFIRQ